MAALAGLQWSHVFSDMVRKLTKKTTRKQTQLQWSHVFSDMVSGKGKFDDCCEVEELQWSHVFSDMVRRQC